MRKRQILNVLHPFRQLDIEGLLAEELFVEERVVRQERRERRIGTLGDLIRGVRADRC